jgi:type IV pilus assembly protein PilA
MLKRLRSRLHGEGGFTLIELLVVILIIGILAAIAIPSFLSQKSKGEDAATKSDARSAQTAMETYYTDNNNYGATVTALQSIEPTLKNATLAVSASNGATAANSSSAPTTDYRVTATGASLRTFSIDRAADGTVRRLCTVPANTDPGACKGATNSSSASSGTW